MFDSLYNHVRTVAFWLDASPLLSDLGLPFRVSSLCWTWIASDQQAGLDDIISLVPIYGDIVSGVLQLYQVYLAFLFGCPLQLIGWMVLNVLIDIVCGIVPIVGDFLDNLFKSNLRNLALLEEWLLSSEPRPSMFHILLMPETTDFIPSTKKPASGSWFGGGKKSAQAESRAKDWARGRVDKTRRMGREEGELWAGRVPPVPSASTPGPSTSRRVDEFDLD